MIYQGFDGETAIVAARPEPTQRLEEVPVIGPRGQLSFRNRTVCLSERNALLASVLVYHFGAELSDVELLERVWPDGATHRTLRWSLRRLDRRLGRVGLAIFHSGYRSHALRPAESLSRPA